jgi:hypothetical protein
MEFNEDDQSAFIFIHQVFTLAAAFVGFYITKDGDGIIFSILIGLSPLLFPIFLLTKKNHLHKRFRVRTFLISSLIGGILSIAVVAWWLYWSAMTALAGFQN